MRGNVIVAAVVVVLLFHSHYNQDGVGMFAAAAAASGGGGGEGEEEKVTTTTPRGTMMTKTVVDIVPVPTRKLSKLSKAFKPDTDEDVRKSLLRLLIFAKALDVHHWMQRLPSSEEAAVARAKNDGGRRELEPGEEDFNEYACSNCVAFYEFFQDVSTKEQVDDFCGFVVRLLRPGSKKDSVVNSTYKNICFLLLRCPSSATRTPTTCCQSLGLCQDPAYYCKLNEDSGSTENYWIQTETKALCDPRSMEIGCGSCKDKGPGDAILEKAGMPKDGFVSHCVGGPCVWTLQRTQCIGLTKYPALTTAKACKDACCDDYTCAVWQFDADGHRDQCWYGKNCDELGEFLAWTYGGIRSMGTDQAPDCVRP